jgi:hypothetical protein
MCWPRRGRIVYFKYKGKSMFTPEFYIDLFQSSKRQLANQIVKDETLNKACNSFIDAQTAFAKMITKNYVDVSTYSVDAISKVLFPKTLDNLSKN